MGHCVNEYALFGLFRPYLHIAVVVKLCFRGSSAVSLIADTVKDYSVNREVRNSRNSYILVYFEFVNSVCGNDFNRLAVADGIVNFADAYVFLSGESNFRTGIYRKLAYVNLVDCAFAEGYSLFAYERYL